MPVNVDYSRGVPVGPAASRGELPKVPVTERRGAFYLLAHPRKWSLVEVDGKYEWLPVLSCMAPRPGVNGATSASSMPALVKAQGDGYIDFTTHPALVSEFGGIVTRHEMADGGYHYTPPWQVVGVRSGKTRQRTDEAMHNDARRIVAKLLGGMDEEVLEDIQQPLLARLSSHRTDRSGGANIASMIKALEERIAAGRAAWERDYKPATKPTRKPKAEVLDG